MIDFFFLIEIQSIYNVFQVYNKVIQLHMYLYIYIFFFRFSSIIDYYRILYIVPCAIL